MPAYGTWACEERHIAHRHAKSGMVQGPWRLDSGHAVFFVRQTDRLSIMNWYQQHSRSMLLFMYIVGVLVYVRSAACRVDAFDPPIHFAKDLIASRNLVRVAMRVRRAVEWPILHNCASAHALRICMHVPNCTFMHALRIMHACAQPHIHACAQDCVFMYTSSKLRIHACAQDVCIHVHTHSYTAHSCVRSQVCHFHLNPKLGTKCTHTHTYTHMYFMHACMHTHTHIYIYIQRHIHTLTHETRTHTVPSSQKPLQILSARKAVRFHLPHAILHRREDFPSCNIRVCMCIHECMLQAADFSTPFHPDTRTHGHVTTQQYA